MPIYDYDGAIKYEIGKLYDNDDVANHQIGKVYDNNGTTNSLIYNSAPEYLFFDGDEYTDFTGGWTKAAYIINNSGGWDSRAGGNARVESGRIIVRTGSGQYNGSGMYTQNKIDMSAIETLTFHFVVNWGTDPYSTFSIIFCSAINGTIYKNITLNSGSVTTTYVCDTTDINNECIVLVQVFTSDGRYIEKHIDSIKVN